MADDDLGCCGSCCLCGVEAICSWYAFFAATALIAVLVAAFGVALPVRATVRDASLVRRDLAGVGGANGTALAYELELTVALRNRNWAMRAELAAPLDAELRFAGRRFDGARLADAGRSVGPRGTVEFRVLASSSRGVALGSDAAAEFARQRVAGVFEMELKLVGEVRYRPVHVGGGRSLEKTCPMKLLVARAPAPAPPGTHLMVFDKVTTCY
ncbi:hypothetical protein ACP70R_031100 [Stipagrostis hirtigluma subsp. patula]